MKIKFKKLVEGVQTPKKAHSSDAGFDITATSRAVRPHYIEYGTSLAIDIPEGYVGLLFPRSSVTNKPLTLGNSVGVIDSGYLGEIKLRFRKSASASLHANNEEELYQIGDRIGQLVVLELPKVELEEVKDFGEKTERNTGGFGSTNLKIEEPEVKIEINSKPKKKAKKNVKEE